jgi:hypothetical protein
LYSSDAFHPLSTALLVLFIKTVKSTEAMVSAMSGVTKVIMLALVISSVIIIR